MSEDLKTKIVITAESGAAVSALKELTAEQGRLRDAAGRFTTQATSGAQSVDQSLAQNVASVETLTHALEALGAAYLANEAKNFAAETVAAFNESAKEGAKLNAVLSSTGHAAGMSRVAINDLTDGLAAMSGVDDEVVSSAESVLLTFRKIRGDEFKEASAAALDMSTVMGGDLKGAALQVGKALNDPLEGVTALRRAGVSFTDSQMDQIKVLVESGRLYEAQKIVLKELNEEFGGAAQAVGSTFGGQVNALNVKMGNLREAVGGVIAGGLQPLVAELDAVYSSAEHTDQTLENTALAMQGLTYGASTAAQTLNLLVTAVRVYAAAEGEYMATLAAHTMDSFASMTGAAATYLETLAKIPLAGQAVKSAAESVRGLSNDLKVAASDWQSVAEDNRKDLKKAVSDYEQNARKIESVTDDIMTRLAGAKSAAMNAQIKENLATIEGAEKMTKAEFEKTYQSRVEALGKAFIIEASSVKDTTALYAELDRNLRSLANQRREKEKEGLTELSASQQKELQEREKALLTFHDRWLKATLEKSAYELEVAQKQYAEDLKLAGKSAELKAKALETYAATAKKIDDDVADKQNKTREAETKKEADALQKALDMREGYAVETAKILLKQDEAELKVLEERIKKAAQTNTLSIGQFAEYQSALKALTAKRVAEGEAVEEKNLIKMLEAEGLTDAEREGIIAQHVARVAAIRGEETAKEIASLDAVTAAVGEHARKQDEFWNTFRLTSDAIAEINKTTWTSIRDQIAQSIKTMKFDIAGLGDFFIATLRNIAATAAANQIVLSAAGATGFTNLASGAGIENLLNLAPSAVPAVTGGSGATGAAGAGLMDMLTGSTPVSLLGAAGQTSGPAAQGLLGVGGEIGGGLIGAGALTGIGLAVGAGLIASGVFSGSNGPPAGYDKNTYGGIGAIRNHPHDALAADTGLLSQHLQGGNAEGFSLVLKQINELNTATSLLDQEFFKNTAAGRAMAQNWGDLTAQGAALANTIDQTGLSSTASAEGMTKMGASAASFAISAILTGQAGNELTTAAVGIATAMNAAAMETDKNLKAMGALGDALYKAGENTWALSRASSAAQLAQQMMNLSADMTFEQYQKLSGGASELTKIEQRRADLMKELAAGVDPERFAAIQAELKGMNAASEGYINSISGVATATGDATANSQDMATATDTAGQAAQRNTPHTDAIGTSFKTAGDRADYAAGRVYALRDEINKLESKTITVSVDTSTGAPAGKAAATGEWFVSANNSKYNLHYGESVLTANDASTYRSLVTQGLWNPLSRGLMPSAPAGGQQVTVTNSIGDIVINAAPGMDVSAIAAEVERRLRQVILEQSERGIPWMHPRGLFGAA